VSDVRAEVDARVEKVLVAEGDHVDAGQVIAVLDPTSFELDVARARAEVGALQAQLAGSKRGGRVEAQRELLALLRSAQHERDLADDEAARAAKLKDSGSIADVTQHESDVKSQVARERVAALQARYDASRSGSVDDVASASYRLGAAQAALALAETNRDHARILAPVSGMVLSRRIDPGDHVRALETTPLFEIADPTRVELRAEVEEMQTTLVQVGAAVSVATPGGREGLAKGHVSRLGPRVGRRSISGDPSELRADSLVRDVFVALDPGEPLNLPLGQRVEVSVELPPRVASTRLPRDAVALREGHAVVEVARGLLREERVVKLVAADDRFVEVDGLPAGARVVRSAL
jgi:multidrug resistance efflux pump